MQTCKLCGIQVKYSIQVKYFHEKCAFEVWDLAQGRIHVWPKVKGFDVDASIASGPLASPAQRCHSHPQYHIGGNLSEPHWTLSHSHPLSIRSSENILVKRNPAAVQLPCGTCQACAHEPGIARNWPLPGHTMQTVT
jgi:hypothetical protein